MKRSYASAATAKLTGSTVLGVPFSAPLSARAQDDDGDEVGEAAHRAEPRVRLAVLALRRLDEEADDDRGDHGKSGDRGSCEVDLPDPLVPAVAAEAANRLAAAAEENDRGKIVITPSACSPRERSPPSQIAAIITIPRPTENPGKNHLDLLICIEHLLDRDAEELAEREREGQRGGVAAVSIELIVCRDTFIACASSACESPRCNRRSLTSLCMTMSR